MAKEEKQETTQQTTDNNQESKEQKTSQESNTSSSQQTNATEDANAFAQGKQEANSSYSEPAPAKGTDDVSAFAQGKQEANSSYSEKNTATDTGGTSESQNKTDESTAPGQQTTDGSTAPSQQKKPQTTLHFYENQTKAVMASKAPETSEERAARLKRERRNKTIAAIGDAISSLSNLYFTTQYAPSSYDPRQSLTAKMQDRYDYLRKEREGNEREYYSALMRAQQLDHQEEMQERQNQNYLEKLRLQNEQFDKKMDMMRQQQEERERHNKEEEARKKQAEADRQASRVESNKIRRESIYHRSSGGGRGSGVGEYTTIETKKGKEKIKQRYKGIVGEDKRRTQQSTAPGAPKQQGSLLPGSKTPGSKGTLLPKK